MTGKRECARNVLGMRDNSFSFGFDVFRQPFLY